jgi:glyoxylase-like metal-dependent hydrolase (beta-lactamase superfamily II)
MTAPTDTPIDFVSPAPVAGTLPPRWNHGVPTRWHAPDPSIQVHHYDEHTVILRQSKSVHYEAPFLYLLFGNDRAVLLDTGATAGAAEFPLRATVDSLIDAWLARHPRRDYGLVVAHSHPHHDHVAADPQFADRPHTTVVPHDVAAVREFFGFGPGWPAATARLDLGGRVLEVLASPGHHEAAVTVYDPWTGILLTGDTVYPGRLFTADFPAFLASLDRMVTFATGRPVTHVLGCHVEMTRKAGRDHPIGARYQPDERSPQLTVRQLTAIRDAAASVATTPGVHRFDDAVIYHQPSPADVRRLLTRGRLHRALGWPLGR